nr:EOG090X04JL [Eurycercus lamellatus]
MHPRNPYRIPPDFKELALKFPDFRKHAKQKLSGKIEIDFKDAAAVRALSTVLLKRDFGLEVQLPPDRLVPTLPLRLNYLLWIEDLLELLIPASREAVHGIDIGTGACCIYPILAAKKNNWKFTATETDNINFQCSSMTLANNRLENNVTLIKVTPDSLLKGNINLDLQYDFSMCNPPFFDSDSFGPKSRTEKRPEPICPKSGGSASASEIAVKGGEVQFVQKLVKESQDIKTMIRIYTTMLGHKSSLEPIKTMIKDAGASSWAQTEFIQGRTMRWALAWTYCDNIPLFHWAKNRKSPSTKKKLTPPLSYIIASERWGDKSEYSISGIMPKILEHLNHLKMEIRKVSESKIRRAVEFIAKENTWSNQRRKRREEKRPPCQQEDVQQPEPKKMKVDGVETAIKTQQEDFFLKGVSKVVREENQSTRYYNI